MPRLSLSTAAAPPADGRTPLQVFVERWSGCTACELHVGRQQVVLARGNVPCDVLFVGEAPGHSEDSLGVPFVGPAGDLLERIIRRALPEGTRYALTNVICCIPLEDGDKISEPSYEAAVACQPRLAEFLLLARPRLLVAVGSVARDWLDPKLKDGFKVPPELGEVRRLDILHPAAILRQPLAQRDMSVQRCVVQIGNAVEDL